MRSRIDAPKLPAEVDELEFGPARALRVRVRTRPQTPEIIAAAMDRTDFRREVKI